MGLLLGLALGLLAFVLSFRPGDGGRRRAPLFALSLVVYLAICGLAFVPLVLSAPERLLTLYLIVAVAVPCGISGAFAGRRKGAEWWLLLAWPVPLCVTFAAALIGR
jgi:hypothetical protein